MEQKKAGLLLVVLGTIGVAIALLLVVLLILFASRKNSEMAIIPTSKMILVPAPTLTPSPTATQYVTPTATQRPGLPPAAGGIQIGNFVQITGTGGAGLRLRSGPGLNFDSKFLGMDSEVFEVKDGPTEASGIQWWYLVAPYDENRAGWAASNYLQIVTSQP